MLKLRIDSWLNGICKDCKHLVIKSDSDFHCGVKKLCGQLNACRSQERAMKFGRYPSGRVRSTPRKRTYPLKKDLPKIDKRKAHRDFLIKSGEVRGLTWVGSLDVSKGTLARRWVKQGRLHGYSIRGAEIRGKSVLYIRDEDFYAIYGGSRKNK